jgi:pimeloyl-ACP methyl ester carboxylesterase
VPAILKQYINLPGCGRLSYQIYGEGERGVILLHGLVGSSWLGDDWISAIMRSNVRCYVPERPGYGDSSQLVLSSVSDWIPIVQAMVKELKINTADVIGCSAGGPYAYATALALPNIINRVYVLDGVPAVYEESVFRHYSEENKAAYQNFAAKPQSEVQAYYMQQMETSKKRLESTGLTYIKTTLDEVIAQKCYGMAQESRLQILPWNLRFSDIEQPVILHHAREDEMVPYDAAK